MSGPRGDWYKDAKNIQGLLLDISGVLMNCGPDGPVPIPGSVQAVRRLKAANIPVRFCTNETTCTKRQIVDKLVGLGFDVTLNEVFPPAPTLIKILQEQHLRPHLLVDPELLPDFEEVDQSNPNCVVLGDAGSEFTYANLNTAFNRLLEMEKPKLFSLGAGRYYRSGEDLVLDVGPYMKALEYACGVEAEIVGKPSSAFFLTVVKDLGTDPTKTVMIGDDIVSDVGGAQKCGLLGIQVRTGKYRPQDEEHPSVTPDGYVDNLGQAVELYLQHRS